MYGEIGEHDDGEADKIEDGLSGIFCGYPSSSAGAAECGGDFGPHEGRGNEALIPEKPIPGSQNGVVPLIRQQEAQDQVSVGADRQV